MKNGQIGTLQLGWVQVMAKLNKLPGVKAVPHDDDLKDRQAHSRIWNETWLSAFFHKPCNHELFVLQSLNMEGAPLWSSTPSWPDPLESRCGAPENLSHLRCIASSLRAGFAKRVKVTSCAASKGLDPDQGDEKFSCIAKSAWHVKGKLGILC